MVSEIMRTAPDDQGAQRRGAWWYLSRGMLLFAVGAGLSLVGAWLGWLWLQIGAFALGVVGMPLIWIGEWHVFRERRSRFWEWFAREYARNERRARAQASPIPSRSEPPAASRGADTDQTTRQ